MDNPGEAEGYKKEHCFSMSILSPIQTMSTVLTQHPFWKNLPSQFFPILEEHATYQDFRAKEKMFSKGQSADYFYLIIEGRVTIETPFVPGEGVISVQHVGAGEPLGWSWFFPPHKWHFTARAVEPTRCIVFDAARLRQLADADPAFGYQLAMRVGTLVTERLQATRSRLLNICEVV